LKILDRYIIREHIAPFLISISLIMLLFTLNLAFRMLSRIVGQGLSAGVIFEFFFLNLAWIIALAIPMSVLVASLMAFGRLAGDREIVALKSTGLGIVRMIRPVLLVALLVSAFSLYFQDQVLPDMNLRNKLLTRSIRQKKPNVALREGTFTRDIPNQTLLVQHIDPETDRLHNLTIFDESNPSNLSTVKADSGRLAYIDTLGMYQFRLYQGEIHQMKREDPETYEILRYSRALFRIDSPEQILQRHERGYRSDRELGLADLQKRIKELKGLKRPDRFRKQIDRYRVEYHKKFAMSAAAIVFVLVGAPLGIKLTHGGLGVSGPLAVLFFLVYWTLLIGGEDVADRGLIHPALAMWLPNIILGIMGVLLIRGEIRQHTTIHLPWQRRRSETETLDGWSRLTEEQIRHFADSEAHSSSATGRTEDDSRGDVGDGHAAH
jgi:lipopolysaccharide export system permease protein